MPDLFLRSVKPWIWTVVDGTTAARFSEKNPVKLFFLRLTKTSKRNGQAKEPSERDSQKVRVMLQKFVATREQIAQGQERGQNGWGQFRALS